MTQRDEELDQLQRELEEAVSQPYVHSPDQMTVTPGLLCWRDQDRVCGADCVAYNPEAEDDTAEKCLALVDSRLITRLLKELVSKEKRSKARDLQIELPLHPDLKR